jgi:hypothetical protein
MRETFSEEDNAHDVAALLKEFIRCLPEPLMTRELYTAFLSTQSKDIYSFKVIFGNIFFNPIISYSHHHFVLVFLSIISQMLQLLFIHA